MQQFCVISGGLKQMKQVFIDGSVGTTGLRIVERLRERSDICLMTLPEEKRKDPAARKEALNQCDIAFLCLPDDAAIEAVSMIENPDAVVLDTSTAHRTDPAWAYGFPELSEAFYEQVKASKRIAVPGCHASGFIALVYPLIEAGFLSPETGISCHSLTGYSGGGKKMIAEYQGEDVPFTFEAPREYGLTQNHKHLKEMQAVTGISRKPLFSPIVANYYSGMLVTVPLFAEDLKEHSLDEIKALYQQKYQGPVVSYEEHLDQQGFLAGNQLRDLDSMKITVMGNEERILLAAAYDNLGKGASGAAVECMNLVMGESLTKGLNL